jgi:breakpoint cluster region protein
LSAEIQRLKKAFEKSELYLKSLCSLADSRRLTDSKAAGEFAKETDVNVLTGLLKLYFRELPEALFTDSLYPSLVNGMSETRLC